MLLIGFQLNYLALQPQDVKQEVRQLIKIPQYKVGYFTCTSH